ncbi:DNA glycosylase AlkZ-like family protein [Streptomyces chengbuensis]|uniref:DNA glycosylase AlkZ-like family protein n=1 Tax=Streptomyces chengbuensis TaxID=3053466 RepID=UPI0033B5634C
MRTGIRSLPDATVLHGNADSGWRFASWGRSKTTTRRVTWPRADARRTGRAAPFVRRLGRPAPVDGRPLLDPCRRRPDAAARPDDAAADGAGPDRDRRGARGPRPTADELTEAVVERAGPWAGDRVTDAFQDRWPRRRQVTHPAAPGSLCFGPLRGRRVTYTHPRRILPGFTPMDGAPAQAELVRRYLRAYRPATPQHFARWPAAPRGWAGEVSAAAARGQAEEVRRHRAVRAHPRRRPHPARGRTSRTGPSPCTSGRHPVRRSSVMPSRAATRS